MNIWLFGSFILPSLSLSTHSDYQLWCLMQEVPRMVFAFSRFMFDKEEESFPGDSVVKKKIYPPVQETWVWSLSQEDPLEKGNGNLLQHSCLGNPVDRGAWRATDKRLSHDLATKEQQGASLNVYKWFGILSTLKI